MLDIPIITREQYKKYLLKYKKTACENATVSDESYVNWWDNAMTLDLKDGSFEMHFYKFQKDGPLLILDKTGKLPEKYIKKLGAYPSYGSELGMNVLVTGTSDGDEGFIYKVSINGT